MVSDTEFEVERLGFRGQSLESGLGVLGVGL
jgi:hypothetical protein